MNQPKNTADISNDVHEQEATAENNQAETNPTAVHESETLEKTSAEMDVNIQEEASDSLAAEADDLQKEVHSLRQQLEEGNQRLLRVQADLDNFRRRTRQEKEEFAKYASMNLISQLLPVVDNFERALAASKENQDFDSLAKGIEMVYRQMNQLLEQEGLKPIEAAGQPFNPEYHQAVMQVESEEHEEGIVVEELQKGYILKEKVLRPSMVKVSS